MKTVEEVNMEYILSFKPIMAVDIKVYNAIVHAITCRNFEIYIEAHEDELSVLFKKVIITIDGKDKELANYWRQIEDIPTLRKIYCEVLERRKQDCITNKEVIEKDLKDYDEFQQMVFYLLYFFGEKLGGIPALSMLSPREIIDYYNAFNLIEKQRNEAFEKHTKKGK